MNYLNFTNSIFHYIHEASLKFYILASLLFSTSKCTKVIDIGCGSGLGTFILSNIVNRYLNERSRLKLKKVVGIDVDPKKIAKAKKFSTLTLTFEQADITRKEDIEKLISKYGKFDCLSMIEVLEHIPKEYLKNVLNNIKNLLKDKGLIFISTPNKYVYDIFSCTSDHVNELKYRELIDILSTDDFHVAKCWGLYSLRKTFIYVMYHKKLIARVNDKCIRHYRISDKIRWHLLMLVFNTSLEIGNILSRLLGRIGVRIRRKIIMGLLKLNNIPDLSLYYSCLIITS